MAPGDAEPSSTAVPEVIRTTPSRHGSPGLGPSPLVWPAGRVLCWAQERLADGDGCFDRLGVGS